MLSQLLQELERARQLADQAFARVSAEHPAQVACRPGCDDCCHAMFDVSPIEAVGLALAFADLPRNQRREVLRRGEKAAKAFDAAVAQSLALDDQGRARLFSATRIPCPLLEGGRCLLYAQRPITCRLYGVPVAAQGRGRICPRAGFQPGQTYPTVHYDKILERLAGLSRQAQNDLPALGLARRDVHRALLLAQNHGQRLRELAGQDAANPGTGVSIAG
ncbi:protein of unknown function UPF0153 [Desulfarculus baarsii DSM 2075]|uniref:YkgJ family cysteine cluster protein n=1 Tax=Desulfarculus baarsii (strain ATCC 33931 / DSM 2075 / LMG 7858 / VKM B-1802 / 2st14) TaxID=644282 RepID=E1QKI4_DESB2|nr:YkgJ family cysteine cluster protein [Desulfarculus baarsii]ADK86077.1 protein of unknown function UPF0153 [Desulfarculus baarsii DSM 2075]